MMETALVFGTRGETLYWHLPPGRSAGGLPDSTTLWEFLFRHKDVVSGVAHTHPWEGPASPSYTDITTFRAIEQGLGKTLVWPIFTFTDAVYLRWNAPWSEPDGTYRRVMPRFAVQERGELLRRSK